LYVSNLYPAFDFVLTWVVVKHDDDARKLAMFKNGHLRLLITLVGFKRIGLDDDPNASWHITSELSADQLKQSLDLIKKAEFSPPAFDDGQEAGDFIRRVSSGAAGRKKATFDDDDGIDDDDDEELMFPAGGPTPMNKSDALKELKKKRRYRKRHATEDAEGGLTDEQLRERAEAKRQQEKEKNAKIKSELFVRDSDDDDDEERDRAFFAQEKLRQKSKIEEMKKLLGISKDKPLKRPSDAMSDESDDDDLLMSAAAPASKQRSKKRQSSAISADSDDDVAGNSGRSSSTAKDDAESEDQATDTPLSSPHVRSSQTKKRKVSIDDDKENSVPKPAALAKSTEIVMDDDDEDEDVPVVRPARQRIRAGFIMDSSDEE
jgi:replication fork protection complex subunit Tof1/Swi1